MRNGKHRIPYLPVRPAAKRAGRMPKGPPERPAECLGAFEPRRQGRVQHRVFGLAEQPMRGTAQAHQLHITGNRDTHIGTELTVKMKRRKMCHSAQGFHRQVTFKVVLDIGKHGLEPLLVKGID
ncbi:hypothetical protein WR25_02892 [Diploscapter pachys]|uniref:Uncharacterized protein n=1 Tax=Diploscapter pachys TaxID=2018661 RepID=A0A2A2M4I8_9BILA|nr:hypothetical protein WR25_02892 [Diploscapter pachys]